MVGTQITYLRMRQRKAFLLFFLNGVKEYKRPVVVQSQPSEFGVEERFLAARSK